MNEKEPQPSDMDRAVAHQVCVAWRNSLPDGSRMNKAQLFGAMSERIAFALAGERLATLKKAIKLVDRLVCDPNFDGNWRNGYGQAQNDMQDALEAAASSVPKDNDKPNET